MLWARAALDSLMNALATAIVLFFVFVVFQFHNIGSFLPIVCLLYLMGLLGLWIGEARREIWENYTPRSGMTVVSPMPQGTSLRRCAAITSPPPT